MLCFYVTFDEQLNHILHFQLEFISHVLWWFYKLSKSKMWNDAWNKLQLKVCQVAHVWLDSWLSIRLLIQW